MFITTIVTHLSINSCNYHKRTSFRTFDANFYHDNARVYDATSYHDNARVYDWAPLALLVETSTLLPQGHLTSLLSNDPDEPSCAVDRENDFNIRIRIPPRGMPICADDRATNCLLYTSPSPRD